MNVHEKDSFVIGIDCGTESVRAGVFNMSGRPLAYGVKEYPLTLPRPGWAEQNPNDWWHAITLAVREAVQKAGVKPERIRGISADATSCTVVVMDKSGNHMRNAIIWMDVRAADQSKRIAASGDPALKYNGWGSVSPEWMPCKALWLKENEPEVYHNAYRVMEFTDWIMYKLTGEYVASINTATARWYYDRPSGGWPLSFYEKIGLEDLIDKFPQRVLDLGEVVGPLAPQAAEALGLPAGIPISQGGADAFVAMIGLNVVRPGRLAFITGSSHLHLGLSEKEFHAPGIFGGFPDAVIPGLSMVEGGQVSTGSVLKWFRDHFCHGLREEANVLGLDVYALLDKRAQALPPGSEGLIVLEYWQGNRTPWVDPDARGTVWGLSLAHRPEHVFRAIMEGIAYGTELIFQNFARHGFAFDEIVACGGPVKSELWMQIHADVSGRPILFTEVAQAPALGSAVLAAVGAGLYSDIAEASDHMVHFKSRLEPDFSRHEEYKFFFDKYVRTYEQLKGLMHEMGDKVRMG